jgi:hypothetical protein
MKDLPTTSDEWYQLGYDDQEWGYPLLDHVWKKKSLFNWKPKYPIKFQEDYRRGQIQCWKDGRARDNSKPWFYEE